jgi:DnaJ-class molecular chaperone
MEICHVCDGSGQTWFMQGGPHGIGQYGRCDLCKGSGRIHIYTCGGCLEKRGHPHPVETPVDPKVPVSEETP